MGLLTGAIDQVTAAPTGTAQPEAPAGPLSTVAAQAQPPAAISPEVAQAYQTLFGREADEAGALGWTQSGLTGQALLDAMVSGAQGDDRAAFERAQQAEIERNYQDLFNRAPEQSGLEYWQNTDLTGQALTNALRLGATDGDIAALYNQADTDISGGITAQSIIDFMNQNANDPYAIYSAAQKYNVDPETIASVMGLSEEEKSGLLNKFQNARTIEQEYRDIGRELTGSNAIDEEGFKYWYGQLESGAITPQEFERAFLTGALDTVSRGYDAGVSSRTVTEALTKGYGGADLLNKVNPLDLYEATRDQGITAEELIARNPNLNADQLNTTLGKAPELYNTFVTDSATNILGEGGTSQIDDAYKAQLVGALVSGDLTREEFDTALQQSASNKVQEANRIANLAVSALGMTQDEATALRANLLGEEYTGDATLTEEELRYARDAFNQSLTSEDAAQESLTDLVRIAANQEGAADTEFFKQNPNALLVYGDLQTRSDNPYTQYGTINGAAVYDADAVDQYLAQVSGDPNLNSASNFAHRRSDNFVEVGGNLDGASAFIRRGADIFGLERTAEMTGDGDSGYTPTGRYTISGDVNAAAQQAGIDPTQFQDTYKTQTATDPETGQPYEYQVLDKTAAEQLYDAINEKTKNLYVIGAQNPANPNEKSPDNFMYTMYQRTEDGKLIPVNEPTYFEGVVNPDVFKKKGMFGGGFLGDVAQSFASIPFVAEAVFIASGGNPAVYAAAKGAQAAAFSNSLKDVGKAAGIAYISTAGMPNAGNVGSTLSGGTLAANSVAAVTLGGAAMGAATGGVMAALSGQDVGKGVTMGLVSGSLSANAANIGNQLLPAETMQSIASTTGLPANQVATIVGNSINGGIMAGITGQNITEAIINNLVINGVSALSAQQVVSNMEGQGLNENALRTIANATAQTMGSVTRAALSGQDIRSSLNAAAPGILTNSAMNYGANEVRAANNQSPLEDRNAVASGISPGLSSSRVSDSAGTEESFSPSLMDQYGPNTTNFDDGEHLFYGGSGTVTPYQDQYPTLTSGENMTDIGEGVRGAGFDDDYMINIKEGGLVKMKTGGTVKGGLPHYENGGGVTYIEPGMWYDADGVLNIEGSGVGSYGDYPEDFNIDITGTSEPPTTSFLDSLNFNFPSFDSLYAFGGVENGSNPFGTALFGGGTNDLSFRPDTTPSLFGIVPALDIFSPSAMSESIVYLDDIISDPNSTEEEKREAREAKDRISGGGGGGGGETAEIGGSDGSGGGLTSFDRALQAAELGNDSYYDYDIMTADPDNLYTSSPISIGGITSGGSNTSGSGATDTAGGLDTGTGGTGGDQGGSGGDNNGGSGNGTGTGNNTGGGGGTGGGSGGGSGGGTGGGTGSGTGTGTGSGTGGGSGSGTGTGTGGGTGGGRGGSGTAAKGFGSAPDSHTIANLTAELTKRGGPFELEGLPSIFKRKPSYGYADGGSVMDHNPQFFSEGGLSSMENRYVKGDGDGTSDSVPAMLANGEFVIPADVVSSLGNGSNDSGAELLDEFLQVIRSHKRNADAKDLPPDSKGPLGYLKEAKKKVK